ncbi:hypothetical protein P8452_23969 [Trifolium repens]|nr:hypothetical protein P8452_23969 [Trifolium repens]
MPLRVQRIEEFVKQVEAGDLKLRVRVLEELLDIRQRQPTGPQLVQQLTKQANDVRTNSISMPLRVQRIEEFVKHVEAGDLKLRVRVLEVGKFFNLHILWLMVVIPVMMLYMSVVSFISFRVQVLEVAS